MAAFKKRYVRLITKKESRAFLNEVKRRKAKGLKPLIHTKLPGKSILTWEIVATTAEEAASGLFKPIGDLLAFIPEQVEDHLWSRLHLMYLPENREVWTNPYWGLLAAIKKMRVHIPWTKIKADPDLFRTFPSSLFDEELNFQSGTPESGLSEEYNPFKRFVERHWLPKWLYASKGAREGYFPDWRRAKAVAGAFGIEVDHKKKEADWFRTMTPDVESEAQRTIAVSEDSFQDMKQAIQSSIEQSWTKREVFEPDWNVLFDQLRGMYGIKTRVLVNRLRLELDPLIQALKAKEPPFEENRSRAYRRASSR